MLLYEGKFVQVDFTVAKQVDVKFDLIIFISISLV